MMIKENYMQSRGICCLLILGVIALLVSGCGGPVNLRSGLVAWYTFDEAVAGA